MQETNVIEKEYQVNMKLNTLYEILDRFNDSQDYPDDVKKSINDLIEILNKYLYHPIEGYDIIKEEFSTNITYKKN